MAVDQGSWAKRSSGSLLAIKRAGAKLIITYFALDIARKLKEDAVKRERSAALFARHHSACLEASIPRCALSRMWARCRYLSNGRMAAA
ncbi:MAG: hypothetical protein ACLTCB_00765 [Merdibacter sp.]